MDAVRHVTTSPPPAPAATEVRPVPQTPGVGEGKSVLPPAATVEVQHARPAAPAESQEKRGYERDAESRALVYRVIDSATGSVIVQIPDETILKARAYSLQDAAETGTAVEKHV